MWPGGMKELKLPEWVNGGADETKLAQLPRSLFPAIADNNIYVAYELPLGLAAAFLRRSRAIYLSVGAKIDC